VQPVVFGSNPVTFDIPYLPDPNIDPPYVYARFRLYDGYYTGTPSPTGMVLNGEVEDYRFASSPTAVELLSFTATSIRKAIVLNWETANETDNLGFNLYRAKSVDGDRIKLNSMLIPCNVPPGSPIGASYEYTDTTVKGQHTYYYWLEDVDIYGATALHGPVSADSVMRKAKPANSNAGKGKTK
jgi:hypothetical protein